MAQNDPAPTEGRVETLALSRPYCVGVVASLATAQFPSKTWKTLDELSPEELRWLDLRDKTPRDAAIPYLPAEPYPFAPPYTAEELGYLAFG